MSIEKLIIKDGIIQNKEIDGIPVKISIVKPKGKRNVRSLIPMNDVLGTTNHNTANTHPTAGDEMHARWLQNVENADSAYVSPHLFVDHDSITQVIPIDEVGYHAGDGKGDGNRRTIGIEICENANVLKAEDNAKKLNAAFLLTFPNFKIYKHQDWSGKYCPRVILRRNGWSDFVSDIKSYVQGAKVKPNTSADIEDGKKVDVDRDIYGYKTAFDAKSDKNRVKLVPKGKYTIMIEHDSGAWNIGEGYKYWINPAKLEDSKPNKPQKPRANIRVDGYWGSATTKALQIALNTYVDGVISGQYRTSTTRALTGRITYTKTGSNVIKALQRKIGVKIDGLIGVSTIKGLQKYLNTKVDGKISSPSIMVKELQRRLNSGTF